MFHLYLYKIVYNNSLKRKGQNTRVVGMLGIRSHFGLAHDFKMILKKPLGNLTLKYNICVQLPIYTNNA